MHHERRDAGCQRAVHPARRDGDDPHDDRRQPEPRRRTLSEEPTRPWLMPRPSGAAHHPVVEAPQPVTPTMAAGRSELTIR
jgi:hypothetical protein